MFRGTTWKPLCLALAGAAAVALYSVADEPPPPPVERTIEAVTESGSMFMREKLDVAHDIIDGLAFEDFGRIERGANKLLKMADEASWRVRRDPVYMHYSADFEANALRLREAAQKRSLGSATFAYMHLTVSCTACHQHVRGVVQVAPTTDGRIAPSGTRVIR